MPVVLISVVGLLRLMLGPGYGVLPLLSVGPAGAAVVGGGFYTLAVGGLAAGEESMIVYGIDPNMPSKIVVFSFIAIAGVTVSGALASDIHRRRERELIEVRAIADVTQRVLLRPVPSRAGPVRLAARYLSASNRARVGGDLYSAVLTPQGLRLIVGDAEGKGLPAVQEAATAMATFRAAAHQERTLAAVADRIEATLNRELGDEQFITAVLAEVSPDGGKMEVISCGHPQPLRLGPRGLQFLGPSEGSLPLGLGFPGAAERVRFSIALHPGEPVLFYTDGLTEARNKDGAFFPLTEAACLRAPADAPAVLAQLCAEVSRYVGHKPHDDVALLLIERTEP